jgi:hypothetical protein
VTDFKIEARHYCRNPKCRSKLPSPVTNLREAFCCRGCHTAFYRTRCRACEGPIEQPKKGGARFICKKSRCISAWNANSGFGRYHVSKNPKAISETPVKSGVAKPLKTDRGWHIVAGRELTPNEVRVATVADASDCQWRDGSFERIEAQNRRLLEAHFAKVKADEQAEIEGNGYFTETDWREVVSPDGVVCYIADSGRKTSVTVTDVSHLTIPDDLSIPDFLRRTPTQMERLAA